METLGKSLTSSSGKRLKRRRCVLIYDMEQHKGMLGFLLCMGFLLRMVIQVDGNSFSKFLDT